MNNSGNSDQNEQGQSVDIKEYLAILWRRKWLIVFCLTLSLGGMTVFLFTRQTIWRINAKLLITKTGSGLPEADVTHDDPDRFIPTQIEILTGPTVLRRIQQRMKKRLFHLRRSKKNSFFSESTFFHTFQMARQEKPIRQEGIWRGNKKTKNVHAPWRFFYKSA